MHKVVSDGHRYVYILGGDGSSKTLKFDIESQMFTNGPLLTVVRQNSACSRSTILNKLFIFGGMSSNVELLAIDSIESISLEHFDNTGWILAKASLNGGNAGPYALTINMEDEQSEFILIIGGALPPPPPSLSLPLRSIPCRRR